MISRARRPILTLLFAVPAPVTAQAPDLARQVEVIRTEHGVPHIRAENLAAAAYALAWVQLEDYGAGVARGLLRARGEMGRWFGADSMESDFPAKRAYDIAVARYAGLDADTRAVYEGFAAGVSRWVELYPEAFPDGFPGRFTGYDVAARDVDVARATDARRFLARLERAADAPLDDGAEVPDVDPIEEGSNAWALAPSRTRSGNAILLRNPHLSWSAGYYEAHVTVPGVLNFYGDFRIGGPFGVIGGFNERLGWATTNNAPDLDEVYALEADPARPDHYLFDGAALPLERDLVTVTFRNGAALSTETREFWYSHLGPVVHRGDGRVYVLRAAGDGDHRGGEQFLRMMRATSLDEWKDAMRMRARVTSNFTYADADGNILYVWNASIPSLPHPAGGDTLAVPARGTSDVWTRYVAWDSLPQVLNPPGGYVHNENDPPYLANLRRPLDRTRYPANFPEPAFRLRSQHGARLIDDDGKLSLEDVIERKHSYGMLLAERVKDDLIAAVRASGPDPLSAQAADVLASWDDTASPESRGGVLFEAWWREYTRGRAADSMFAVPWSLSEPVSTPRGLADPAHAAAALGRAAVETVERHGTLDVAWGEVHRVRVGDIDVPVGGCSGALGCFRVLNFRTDADGKRSVIGGDGWVLTVEFDDVPRARSILAYGQSADPASPWHSDQAAMFARGELKPVRFTERDVDAAAVDRYRPGVARR